MRVYINEMIKQAVNFYKTGIFLEVKVLYHLKVSWCEKASLILAVSAGTRERILCLDFIFLS